jgi:hypothetical protein
MKYYVTVHRDEDHQMLLGQDLNPEIVIWSMTRDTISIRCAISFSIILTR